MIENLRIADGPGGPSYRPILLAQHKDMHCIIAPIGTENLVASFEISRFGGHHWSICNESKARLLTCKSNAMHVLVFPPVFPLVFRRDILFRKNLVDIRTVEISVRNIARTVTSLLDRIASIAVGRPEAVSGTLANLEVPHPITRTNRLL